MSTTMPVNPQRRIWITATSVAGGVGLVATAIPFVASLAPSEKARALGAPVEVGLSGLLSGELKIVEWQGKPVFVLRRTREMLDALGRHDDLIVDPKSRRSLQPDYAQNVGRSAKPEILVLEGICTHLGCMRKLRCPAGWPGPGSRRTARLGPMNSGARRAPGS